MRPIRPWQIAAWVAIAYLAFGPEIALPAIPWLPSVGGPRHLVIVRESADDTPQIARTLTNLRQGTIAKQLADAGHKLTILDDDEAGVPVLEKFKPFTPPELLVLTLSGDKLVRRKRLPDSAAQVLEAAQ